jgi:hypothetical protein
MIWMQVKKNAIAFTMRWTTYGLKIIGKCDISLKVKQYEVLKAVVLARKEKFAKC